MTAPETTATDEPLPHPADFGIRIRRCLDCGCDTRAEAIMCLVERSSADEIPVYL